MVITRGLLGMKTASAREEAGDKGELKRNCAGRAIC